MSIPITEAIAILSLLGMACSLSWRPLPASLAGGAGAQPDHPINGPRPRCPDAKCPRYSLTDLRMSRRCLFGLMHRSKTAPLFNHLVDAGEHAPVGEHPPKRNRKEPICFSPYLSTERETWSGLILSALQPSRKPTEQRCRRRRPRDQVSSR